MRPTRFFDTSSRIKEPKPGHGFGYSQDSREHGVVFVVRDAIPRADQLAGDEFAAIRGRLIEMGVPGSPGT